MPIVNASVTACFKLISRIAVFLTLCLVFTPSVLTNLTPPANSNLNHTTPKVQVMSTATVDSQTPAPKKSADILRFAPAFSSVPSDRYAGQQWSLQSNDQHTGASDLFGAHEFLGSATEIIVAVVDSGVILNHEDLYFLPGYDFIHDPKVSNDNDGRDADPSDPGDWISQYDLDQQQVADGCPLTASKWHGTAISGIIGAISQNAAGIAGGSPSVALLPVRVTGKCGGYVADLIDGIRWSAGLSVAGVEDNPNPAQVINLSVGFPGRCSNAMQSAINDAVNTGSIVVTASTNTSAALDNEPYSPASCENVITVAATDREGSITPYSALGNSVFISAPGGTITDGIITTQNDGSESPLGFSSYGFHYGTSIAAAHVSAAIANLLSYQSDLSKLQVEQLLSLSASSTNEDKRCQTDQCGIGRLNAAEAVAMLAAGILPDDDFNQTDSTPVLLAATGSNTSNDDVVITPAGSQSGIGSIDLKVLLLLLFFALTCRNVTRKL